MTAAETRATVATDARLFCLTATEETRSTQPAARGRSTVTRGEYYGDTI